MSSWRPPAPSNQGQSMLLATQQQQHLYQDASKSTHHGQDDYQNRVSHFSKESRPPFPPFMSQNAPPTTYQNDPSNAFQYNRSVPPPPLQPPQMAASTAPSNTKMGQVFHPLPPPPSSCLPMPPPNINFEPGRLGQPPRIPFPPPPLPHQTPTQDGRDQPGSSMMFDPSVPPPRLPALHPPPLRPPTGPHPPPPNQRSHDSSPSGPMHGQWNQSHRPLGDNSQTSTVNLNAPHNLLSQSHSADRENQHRKTNHAQHRLQPYQSFRSKQQSETSRKGSFLGISQKPSGTDGFLNSSSSEHSMGTEIVKQREAESEDQKWVNNWSKSIKKIEIEANKARAPVVKISEARTMLSKFLHLLDQLKKKKEEASDLLMKERDERKWLSHCKEMKRQTVDLSQLETVISAPEFVEGLKKQLERRRKKRERIRRHRHEDWEMREQELKKRNERIDASLAAELQAKQEKEEEEKLQKDVDKVLSEVHTKKRDATKTMELFRALRKLRQLRKESAERRGQFPSSRLFDEMFDEKISSLETMMNKQKLLYVEEEKALQVMLEEEHEETREKARKKKEVEERQKAEKAWQHQLEILFGKTEELDLGHPLFIFRQFFQQASHDLQSLINIRRQWDMFVVPESDQAGSSIPVSWVIPSEPTNHIWATALEDPAGS